MADLIIFSGKLKGQRLILPDREVIVGRDETCHMRIASSLISRRHCSLKGSPDGVLVRDLESQNGTYVNDVAITEPYLMKPGDILRVGAALFQVPRLKPGTIKVDTEHSNEKLSSWLTDTDDEQTQSVTAPETTVIKGRQQTSESPSNRGETPQASSISHEQRNVPAIRPSTKSIKEQAAEIIRRHWESVRGNQTE